MTTPSARPRRPLPVLLALLLGALPAVAGDRLLVSGFVTDAVGRLEFPGGETLPRIGVSHLDGVLGACLGPDGHLYVCSEEDDRVVRFAVGGGQARDVVFDDPATAEDETGGLDGPSSVVFGPDGHLYVASFAGDAVLRYDGHTGAFLDVFVEAGAGGLDGPDAQMAFGPDGHLYVPSYWNNRVLKFDGASGASLGAVVTASDGLSRPRTILFPGGDVFLVASEGNDRVLECSVETGEVLRRLVKDIPSTPEDENGPLNGPTGLALGPDGLLYVASVGNNRVLTFDPDTGAYLGVTAVGLVIAPTHLLVVPDMAKYLDPSPHSAGPGTRLTARGSCHLSAGHLSLEVSGAPPGVHGAFLMSTTRGEAPLGDGVLGLSWPWETLAPARVDDDGRASHPLVSGPLPPDAERLVAGATLFFQFVHRDTVGAGLNLSDGLALRLVD